MRLTTIPILALWRFFKDPKAPGSRMWTTKLEISLRVFGQPDFRFALPSYFCAISFRCHANNVSGVTMVAI